MSSDVVESQPVVKEYHTPFCENDCEITHHPLLQTIIRLTGHSRKDKAELNQCITKYEATGWALDDPIPDTVPEFRYPIIHWVAALSKSCWVTYLMKEGCNIKEQTKQGDTPLHRCIICLKPQNKRSHSLADPLAKNLSMTNAKGQTPLLLLAERVEHGQITLDMFSDWLIAIIETTMKMMDVGERLKTFNTQNQQGDTTLHLLCKVRSMLPSVRRLTQEARCNVSIRNKLGLTAMDVAASYGFYDYVTEIKRVLPTGSQLVSPLRSSHPMGKTEKSPGNSPRNIQSAKSKHKVPSRLQTNCNTSTTQEVNTHKKNMKRKSPNATKRAITERSPPKLQLEKLAVPTDFQAYHLTKELPIMEPSPSTPKRARKETLIKIDSITVFDKPEKDEQRIRASNLDRILQSQCQATPVTTHLKENITIDKTLSEQQVSADLKQLTEDSTQQSENSTQQSENSTQQNKNSTQSSQGSSPSTENETVNCATTSGSDTDANENKYEQHSSNDDKCVLCNLESHSEMTQELGNGSKVSEQQVCTAAAGPITATEPGAGSKEESGSAHRKETQGNSKLLTYLQMNQDFQKEIINKIHKDRRELEKVIGEQENSIKDTLQELAKTTSDSKEVIRMMASTIQKLKVLQAKEKNLKMKQDKLKKIKKTKDIELEESRTQLAVIAQSLLELQG